MANVAQAVKADAVEMAKAAEGVATDANNVKGASEEVISEAESVAKAMEEIREIGEKEKQSLRVHFDKRIQKLNELIDIKIKTSESEEERARLGALRRK